ncbi:hypothetical protein TNCV_2029301 [Trichonephila clavipes]|nr:hypothetical protein TNCV_2029301 [Trichonephila clavipes]
MWTDQIVLGKEKVQDSSGSIVSKKTINARNWKSQRLEVKSQDLHFLFSQYYLVCPHQCAHRKFSRLKWIDCLEKDNARPNSTGKEEVQDSSGSIVSKKTINARNWKSQRLEVKSQDLHFLFPSTIWSVHISAPTGSFKAQWDRLSRKRQCQVLKKSKAKT